MAAVEVEVKPPTGDEVPPEVGDATNTFVVGRKKALGCGNFGAVFPGVSKSAAKLEVAIKFEIAHNGYVAVCRAIVLAVSTATLPEKD